MLKAPLVKPGKTPTLAALIAQLTAPLGTDVVNSLSRQRNGLEAFLKACIGL